MKRMIKTLVISTILSINMLSVSFAEEMSPEFSQFILTNQSYINLLNEKAEEINAKSAITCTTLANRERLVPDILFPISFEPIVDTTALEAMDSPTPVTGEAVMSEEEKKAETEKNAAFPTGGQWIEHIRQNGCAVPRQLNILAVALPGKEPKLFGMNSGTTIADPFLQDKAQPIVNETVKAAELECKVVEEAVIADTLLEGYIDQTGSSLVRENMNNGWQERWITSTCGQRVDVRVQFIPSKKEDYLIRAYLYQE
jgi:hypothetical protein